MTTIRAVALALALVACSSSSPRPPAEAAPGPAEEPVPIHVPRFTATELAYELLGGPLPIRLPDEARTVHDPLLGALVERLVIWTDDLDSVVYFLPGRDSRLVVYHQGHTGDARVYGLSTIRAIQASGAAVLVLSMPMRGENLQPFETWSHDWLADRDHPLRYFVEPVSVALNWAELLRPWSSVTMVGLSGGGWTTALVAGLDERVTASWAVAGTWPDWLRAEHGPGGDLEQRLTLGRELDLYSLANDPVHVLNREDPCCFAGERYDGYAERVAGLNVLIDENDQHSISAAVLAAITEKLDQ